MIQPATFVTHKVFTIDRDHGVIPTYVSYVVGEVTMHLGAYRKVEDIILTDRYGILQAVITFEDDIVYNIYTDIVDSDAKDEPIRELQSIAGVSYKDESSKGVEQRDHQDAVQQ